MGYHRAGFDVTGVDIEPHPDYPFEFIQDDAVKVLAAIVAKGHRGFDVIHASPPCHDWSDLAARTGEDGTGDLLFTTRSLLRAWGGPYVIENVEGAPLLDPLLLCGSEFALAATCRDGVRRQLRRHRLFESNMPLMGAGGCRHRGQPVGVYGTGGGGQMTRGYKAHPEEARESMGIDWMNRGDIAQAIPPAYTEFIGAQLLDALGRAA